jgi:hypothetical protein
MVSNWTIIDAEIYGDILRAKIDILEKEPPVKILKTPNVSALKN